MREAGTISTRAEGTDRDLVEAVRAGDDVAFEELYRRYRPRIAAYVRRRVSDPARAEDIAQDAFFSALRRMRATDAQIAFKPWIFEIARNAAIDHWRRTSRAEEISVEEDERLRQSDRVRLTGAAGPDSVLVEKERFEHLRGAFDELSDVHTRILVLRELEGLSYREIAERLELTESSVQSALFRARRRLESEYADISEGRRCVAMRRVMGRIAEGLGNKREEGRLARHARRCHVCRRRARELGVDIVPPLTRLARKAAALLPLPLVPRRGGAASSGAAAGGQGAGGVSGLLPAGAQVGAVVAERTAAIVAAAAIAGAGGVALSGADVLDGHRERERAPVAEQRTQDSGTEAGTGRSPAMRKRPRPGGAAGEAGPRAGGRSHRGQAAQRARPEQSGVGAASGADLPDGPGAVRGTDSPAPDAGDVRLPSLPDTPAEVGGGGPSGPSAPRLPEPPSPPSVDAPRAPTVPEVPLAAPGVESAPPAPVEPPAVPNLPPVDAGVPPDAVTAIGGG
jgi:RNA polymerase sigma factor (sigma-70 family)